MPTMDPLGMDILGSTTSKEPPEVLWIQAGLEEALLEFISEACDDCWQLRVTAYEFTHKEVVQHLLLLSSEEWT